MDTNNIHVHHFTETIVPPTCQENGYTLYRCDCGYEHKSQFKPVGEHTYRMQTSSPATCTEGGSITMVCSVCGQTKVDTASPIGHAYGDWSVQALPSCTTEGQRIHQCERCGVVEEAAIPPIGHKCVKGTSRRINRHTVEFFCENCGETVQATPTKMNKVIKRILLAVVTLLLLVAGTWAVRHAALPGYHYLQAKHHAQAGNHDDALKHYRKLAKLAPDWKKLQNFTVVNTGVTVETNQYYDGEISYHRIDKTVYEYDKHGNLTLQRTEHNDETTSETSYEYEYDKQGRILCQSTYNQSGELTGKIKFKYGKDGKATDRIEYDAEGNVSVSYELSYDKEGNLKTEYGSYSKNEYKYDKDGRLTKLTTYYMSEQNWVVFHSYEYDEQGNPTYYTYDPMDFHLRYKNEYDQNGVLEKRYQYVGYGDREEMRSILTYEYDDFLVFYKPNK